MFRGYSQHQICTNRIPSPSFCGGQRVPHPPGDVDAPFLFFTTLEQSSSLTTFSRLCHTIRLTANFSKDAKWPQSRAREIRLTEPYSHCRIDCMCGSINLVPFLRALPDPPTFNLHILFHPFTESARVPL